MSNKTAGITLKNKFHYLINEIGRDLPFIINSFDESSQQSCCIYRFVVHTKTWTRIESTAKKLCLYLIMGENTCEKTYLVFLEENNGMVLLKMFRDNNFDKELAELLVKALIQKMEMKYAYIKSCL